MSVFRCLFVIAIACELIITLPAFAHFCLFTYFILDIDFPYFKYSWIFANESSLMVYKTGNTAATNPGILRELE